MRPEVREWVAGELGPTGPWVRLDAQRGSTAVFAVAGYDCIVKHFSSVRGFEQERRALAWCSGELGGARVPRVIAAAPQLATLILERLPGATPPEDAPAVHHAAGHFLAALHRIELADDDPLPLGEALIRRTESWRRRAALDPKQARIVDHHGPRPELFAGARRVPCHRDFAPRNWLWDGETLAVIDFEHARPDLALVDLAKLCVGPWLWRPDCATAFFLGHGRVPDEQELAQLRAVVVLHGLASLAWGQERGVVDHVHEGCRALDVAADWPPRWA
jgi:hypothetical protein